MSESIPGGWSDWNFDNLELYSTLLQKHFGLGVGYEVLAYATQVVAGTNYVFLTKTTLIYPPFKQNVVRVDAFLSLENEWTIKEEIKPVEPN